MLLVAIDPAQPAGTAVNTAIVASPTPDPNTGDNTDDAPLEVTLDADLSIMKSHDPQAVHIGDTLDCDLAVRNEGPTLATTVTVTDVIPAGLEYVGSGSTDAAWAVSAGAPASDGTTTVTATLAGSLAPGATAPALQLVVRVTAAAYPSVTNVASVGADQPDSQPDDNQSDDPTAVPPLAELVVAKEAVGSLRVGLDGSYRITVENRGPTADPGPIVVADDLPAGLAFRSASGDGVHCSATGQQVRCTIDGVLDAGGTVAVTLVTAVGEAAYPAVVNRATVTTPTEQTPDAVLSDSVETKVASAPLVNSGSTFAIWAIVLAIVVILGGAALLVLARRRRLPGSIR